MFKVVLCVLFAYPPLAVGMAGGGGGWSELSTLPGGSIGLSYGDCPMSLRTAA